MLRLDSKNTNYSGACIINGAQIGYLSGSRAGNNFNVSFNIDDSDTYANNRATILADIEEFIDEVAEYQAFND